MQETFLVANTDGKVILHISFPIFSNMNISFAEQKLALKLYIPAEILPIAKKIQIIDQKKFVVTALNSGKKVFMIHIVSPGLNLKISIYLACDI